MSDMSYPPQNPGGIPAGASPPAMPPTVPPTQVGAADRETTPEAKERAGEVAHEAKERAGEVAHEAKERARNLLDQARDGATEQAATQQERLAAGLHHLGAELAQMSRSSDDPGYATELAERGAETVERLADWFERREPGDVVAEVQDFARRRPGAFLAIAAGAGLVVGRLLRGGKEASGTSPTRREPDMPPSPPPVMSTSDAPTAYPTTAMGTSVPPTTGGASHVHHA